MAVKRAPLWADLTHGLAVALYAVSFFLPACQFFGDDPLEVWWGWEAFLATSPKVHQGFFPPLANPLFWIALVLWWRRAWGVVAALALSAAVFAASVPYCLPDVPLREGYHLWCGAFGVLFVPAFLMHLRERRDPERPAPRRQAAIALAILTGTMTLLLIQLIWFSPMD